MYKMFHNAVCSNCRKTYRCDESGAFINNFHLPDICSGCGEHMAISGETSPHWRHVILKKKYHPAVWTRNPLTWFRGGHWETVEETDMRAR